MIDETKTPLHYRQRLTDVKRGLYSGSSTMDDCRQAAQDYIDSIKAYKKRTGKRVPVPTISKLLR